MLAEVFLFSSPLVFVLENHAELSSNGVFLRGVVQDIGPDCHPVLYFYCLDSSFGLAIGLGVARAAGDVDKLVCISEFSKLLA